jgi:hypothetical protein
MRKWGIVVTLALAAVLVVLVVVPCVPAGCDCADTCGGWNLANCVESGYGQCFFHKDKRCDVVHGGVCGYYDPTRSDCWYMCSWTEYQCGIGNYCEHIESEMHGCGN